MRIYNTTLKQEQNPALLLLLLPTVTTKAWHLLNFSSHYVLKLKCTYLNGSFQEKSPNSFDQQDTNTASMFSRKCFRHLNYTNREGFSSQSSHEQKIWPHSIPNFHHMWSWEADQWHSRLNVSSKLIVTSNNMKCTHFRLQLCTTSF